ncbi:NAD(P)-dependent alcohol dehydrogenase [Allonocardiopsis opalescens]|uniref:NADPH:quinone reductase-like Zn-dependent oxidoreductase n=1 Tax=Allonocardiopsis opalescens TaxID=1144618 RepID=A0A2T0PYS6_9ACTN|nr:NAD(P)-dependent alcohol dehydrogenase [Allonocardiopsis opalescens]PRX96684.1 NADPH:quinone reductase-like Zn-dependent oxidoreductase [Allonocardiopsis opalescens]
MKAYVQRSYGSPDSLRLEDVPRPVPGDDEVLVRVHATSVNPYDWHNMRGEPRVARVLGELGLRRPKIPVLGADLAGTVAEAGAKVTEFAPGDEVFAMVEGGGFAEYACVRAELLARKPRNLSFEQAAAVPLAANTALVAVRDDGGVRSGHRVLVNGASGGVGTFAVQIARALGASVTGVCGPRNVTMVKSIGADDVVDYTVADFTRTGRHHDLVVDIAGSRSMPACRRALAPKGGYVVVGGPPGRWVQPMGHVMAGLALAPLLSQRAALTNVLSRTDKKAMLETLTGLIESGEVTPVIDRTYPFDKIPAAVGYLEQGHASGKVVVTV